MSEDSVTQPQETVSTKSPEHSVFIAPVIGFIGFFGLIIVAMLMGGSLVIFINIPSIVVCVGGMIGLSLMVFSYSDLSHALWQIPRVLFPSPIPPNDIHPADIEVLRGMTVHVYASGAIGVFIGAVQILAGLDDPSSIGAGIATVLLCSFYSLLIAEGILRPIAHHLARRLAQ